MLLFIVYRKKRKEGNRSFNTSHVTLYQGCNSNRKLLCKVSIHLMLLFIQRHFTVKLSGNFVSIHLMLLFINKTGGVSYTLYRVSIHLMLLFIGAKIHSIWPLKKRFNTSHVTLYLFDNGNIRYLYEFQYISYYSLSIFLLEIQHNEQNVSIHLMLLFIHGNSLVYLSLIRFNTSHVTLYLRAFAKNPDRTACFNTSHVTLYLFL